MNIFTPINDLVELVYQADLSNLVYNLFAVLGYVCVFVLALVYRKHYGISKRDAILIPLLLYILGSIWIRLIGWAESGFTIFGPNNIVKGYSFFPLFGLLVAKWFKKDFRLVMDFTAPCFPLTQFVCHLGCPFIGCCCGFPMENGLWHPFWRSYLFPCQLLESFVAGIITVVCILIARKDEYRVTGKIYPIFLILFGGTRFFLEFLRDNTKLFWGISDLALWALLMVVVGTVWLIVDKKKAKEPEKA